MRSRVNNVLKTGGDLVSIFPHHTCAGSMFDETSVDTRQVIHSITHKLRTAYSHVLLAISYLCEYSFYSVSTTPTIRPTTKEMKGIL